MSEEEQCHFETISRTADNFSELGKHLQTLKIVFQLLITFQVFYHHKYNVPITICSPGMYRSDNLLAIHWDVSWTFSCLSNSWGHSYHRGNSGIRNFRPDCGRVCFCDMYYPPGIHRYLIVKTKITWNKKIIFSTGLERVVKYVKRCNHQALDKLWIKPADVLFKSSANWTTRKHNSI